MQSRPYGATLQSRPARALWIEIKLAEILSGYIAVEAREGLVD